MDGKTAPRLYSAKEVRAKASIGNTTLWKWQKDPRYNFPKPIKVGGSRTNRWAADAVDGWLSAQIAKATGAA